MSVTGLTVSATPAAAYTESNCNFFDNQDFNYWVGVPRQAPGYRSCYMKFGDKDEFVAAVQRAYNLCYKSPYLPAISENGIFGSVTLDRVKKIQRAEGIQADGSVGDETMWNMLWPVTDHEDHRTYQGWCWEKY